jgi:hypothetical protein
MEDRSVMIANLRALIAEKTLNETDFTLAVARIILAASSDAQTGKNFLLPRQLRELKEEWRQTLR